MTTQLQRHPLRFDASMLAQLEPYPLIGSLAEWLRQNLTATTKQIQGWLISGAKTLLHTLATQSGIFVLSALGTIIHFFMMLFLLFFLLRDGRQLLDCAMRLIPIEAQRKSGCSRWLATRHAPLSTAQV